MLNNPQRQSLNRVHIVICLLIFLLSLAFYLKKMSPSIYIGDSGELITAAASLGVPHPPGSPLFALIGNCFSKLPLSSHAWRVNFSTIFCGALTLTITFLIFLSLGLTTLNACLLSLFCGSGYVFMIITSGTEVYCLHLLIITLSFLAFLSQNRHVLSFSILLCFIGMGAHATSIFILPTILIFAFLTMQQRTKVRLSFLFFIIIGLSIYLYLPLRAVTLPQYNWGHTFYWSNFWRHVTNQKDADLLNQLQIKTIFVNAGNFFRYLTDVFTHGGIIIVLISLYFSLRKNLKWAILVFSFIIPYFLLYLPLPRLPRAHLYAPVFLALFFLFAQAFNQELKFPGSKYLKPLVILILLLINLTRFSAFTNERNNYSVYDHANSFIQSCAPFSYLIASGDITQYGILYLQTIEKKRTDIELKTSTPNLYRLYPSLPQNSTRNQILKKLKFFPSQFTSTNFVPYLPDIPLVSNGVIYVLYPDPPKMNFSRFTYRGYDKISPEKDFWYQYLFINRLQNQAAYYRQIKKYDKAVTLLNKALDIGYDTGVLIYLAEIYLEINDLSKADDIINELYLKKPHLSKVVSLKKELELKRNSQTIKNAN